MRLRLTQLPFPHHLRLMDLILSPYPLLQQRHPLRLAIPAAAGDTVQVLERLVRLTVSFVH